MMTKPKLNPETTKLFDIFNGDFVSIITTQYVESVTQSEHTVEQVKSPIMIEGFLTDEDDNYYFLGSEPDCYEQAVKKEFTVIIEIKNPPMPEISKPVPFKPSTDRGLN